MVMMSGREKEKKADVPKRAGKLILRTRKGGEREKEMQQKRAGSTISFFKKIKKENLASSKEES